MKWVHTDLNSPWYPMEDSPYPSTAKDYPEQYRRVSNELHARLRTAWDALDAVSAEVNKNHPLKRKP